MLRLFDLTPETDLGSSAVLQYEQEITREFHTKMKSSHWTMLRDEAGTSMEKLDQAALRDLGILTKSECFRLQVTAPCTPEHAIDLLLNYERRLKWDSTIAAGMNGWTAVPLPAVALSNGLGLTVETTRVPLFLPHPSPGSDSNIMAATLPDGGSVRVLRTLSNPALGGVISPREFVDISFTRFGAEVTHLATSVNLSTHPPAKGFVRGRNMPCGLLFKPVDEGTATKITYIVHSDVGGWLPHAVVNKGTVTTLWNIMSSLPDVVKAHP